jgi:UDP-2-acetamido-2,6-beta-L-arabino-hexul-4-ose reductase
MKVLITGNKGFIGRNLTEALAGKAGMEILPFDKDSNISLLEGFTKECDFVYHLAAVHRPPVNSEFDTVNRVFFEYVLSLLQKNKNSCPVLLTSSIQAGTDSEYGMSKLAAEEALKRHADQMNSKAIIYRLTNTFGRYALPNHHSVVANFCYNVANNLPVTINDPERVMNLYYIDDVIASFLTHLDNLNKSIHDGFFRLPENQMYSISLQNLSDMIYSFKSMNHQFMNSELDEFSKKLNETFLYYQQNAQIVNYEI